MKISELIAYLESTRTKHGDLDVVIETDFISGLLDERHLEVTDRYCNRGKCLAIDA